MAGGSHFCFFERVVARPENPSRSVIIVIVIKVHPTQHTLVVFRSDAADFVVCGQRDSDTVGGVLQDLPSFGQWA